MKNNICFIDFETSGIDVFKDNPIELGAILVDSKGDIQNLFHSYIRPRTKREFSKNANNIHGIESANLVDAPTQKEVLKEFFNIFGTDYCFGGWNINFDVSFFRSMCHHSNMMNKFNKINHRHIDVQTMKILAVELGYLNPRTHSLDDLVDAFSLKRSEKHSAIEDAKITSKIYFEFLNLFKSKSL